MRDAQPTADILRVVDQRRELIHRGLGPHELDHLDLIELVPRLMPRTSRPALIFSRLKHDVYAT